jgi:hypothetical protein
MVGTKALSGVISGIQKINARKKFKVSLSCHQHGIMRAFVESWRCCGRSYQIRWYFGEEVK